MATKKGQVSQQAIERLFHGLAEILQNKSIADIKVEDISSRAGMHRATFYRHVESIQDLCHRGMDIFFDSIIKDMEDLKGKSARRANGDIPAHIELFFQTILEKKVVLSAILGSNGPGFFRKKLEEKILNFLKDERLNNGLSSERMVIKAKLTASSLMAAMEMLIEGHSYSLCIPEYYRFVSRGLGFSPFSN